MHSLYIIQWNIYPVLLIAPLTHWGRVTDLCVSKSTIIGSDNGLSPGWRQAIIWTNAGILFIGPLETNFNEILIKKYTFSFNNMHLKISSAKWRPFCLSLNELTANWCDLFSHVPQGCFRSHVDNKDCKCGRPFRKASETGPSPNLVAVTWKCKKLV